MSSFLFQSFSLSGRAQFRSPPAAVKGARSVGGVSEPLTGRTDARASSREGKAPPRSNLGRWKS